jgi:hypothetical protein
LPSNFILPNFDNSLSSNREKAKLLRLASTVINFLGEPEVLTVLLAKVNHSLHLSQGLVCCVLLSSTGGAIV